MKKFVYLIFTVTVIAGFTSCKSSTKKEEQPIPPTVEKRDLGGLKIAYYHSDSLKEQFTYFKNQEAIVTKKQKAFQQEVERRTKEYQNFIVRNNEKLQSGMLSQNEQMQIQQQAQRLEADLMQYQQAQGAKLEEETLKKLEAISKKIEAFGKRFCEENKIDILLIHGPGGQVNYISPAMDVTRSFTSYLNAHQSEIEADIQKK
jgi:Skp family chaperone for outer membrane proteins